MTHQAVQALQPHHLDFRRRLFGVGGQGAFDEGLVAADVEQARHRVAGVGIEQQRVGLDRDGQVDMAVAAGQRTGAQGYRQRIARRIDMNAARLDPADGARPFQQAAHQGAFIGDEDIADHLAAQVFRALVEQGLGRTDRADDAEQGVDFDEQVGRGQGEGNIAVPLRLEVLAHTVVLCVIRRKDNTVSSNL